MGMASESAMTTTNPATDDPRARVGHPVGVGGEPRVDEQARQTARGTQDEGVRLTERIAVEARPVVAEPEELARREGARRGHAERREARRATTQRRRHEELEGRDVAAERERVLTAEQRTREERGRCRARPGGVRPRAGA